MKNKDTKRLDFKDILKVNAFEDYARYCLSYLITQVNSVILDFLLSQDKNRIGDSLPLLVSSLKIYLLLKTLYVIINIANNELNSLMESTDKSSSIKEQVNIIMNDFNVIREHMMALNRSIESELNRIIK